MILDDIIAIKRKDLEERQRLVPLKQLKELAQAEHPPLSMSSAIKGSELRLIAEIKRASPSKGLLCRSFDPAAIAHAYVKGGAAAISVLTEYRYFSGSLEHLKAVRAVTAPDKIPLMRKDFIFDPYQIYETRAWGADCLLLIAAILDPAMLEELLVLAHELDMDCLVEIHGEEDLEKALYGGAGIIGINNRDLRTFKVDMDATFRLRPLIPPDRLVVSESGISTAAHVARLKDIGINAVLIGEALISAPDPAEKIRELFR